MSALSITVKTTDSSREGLFWMAAYYLPQISSKCSDPHLLSMERTGFVCSVAGWHSLTRHSDTHTHTHILRALLSLWQRLVFFTFLLLASEEVNFSSVYPCRFSLHAVELMWLLAFNSSIISGQQHSSGHENDAGAWQGWKGWKD